MFDTLSVRSRNCALKLGVKNLADFCKFTSDEILAVKHAGVTSLNEIREALAKDGMCLAEESDRTRPFTFVRLQNFLPAEWKGCEIRISNGIGSTREVTRIAIHQNDSGRIFLVFYEDRIAE